QTAAWIEERLDQQSGVLAPALLWDVDKLRADEVEAPGRLPGERVPDEDPVRPLRQALSRELGDGRREIEPVRLDPVGGPVDDALEQVPVRAPDVEEAAVAVDRFCDRPAAGLPACLVTAEPRLRARRVALEVGGVEDRRHAGKPGVVVDLASLARLSQCRGASSPRVRTGSSPCFG